MDLTDWQLLSTIYEFILGCLTFFRYILIHFK